MRIRHDMFSFITQNGGHKNYYCNLNSCVHASLYIKLVESKVGCTIKYSTNKASYDVTKIVHMVPK